MLWLFFVYTVVQSSGTIQKIAPRVCANIFTRDDCWGPSTDSPDNICLWNSGDGECNPESIDDMEKLCETFMMESSCRNRDLCVWNADDYKCQSDEGEEANSEMFENESYLKDCSLITTNQGCRGYAGMGMECRWVAKDGVCANGYFGNMDVHCGAFKPDVCQNDGACFVEGGVCVSRSSHPNGAPGQQTTGGGSTVTGGTTGGFINTDQEAPEPEEPAEPEEPEEPQEAESPTLEKGNPLVNDDGDYTAGFWFLGVCGVALLFGAVVKLLFYKSTPTPPEELLCDGPEPILLSDGSALII